MRVRVLLMGLLLTVYLPSGMAAEPEAPPHYVQRCAACHLADGAGVPGAFPPLARRVDAIASSDAGRRYLVAVITHGVTGPLEIDGVAYQGVMPPQAGLSHEQVAQLLNGLRTWGASSPAAAEFTAAEVERLRSADASLGMAGVAALRPASVK